MPAPVLRWELAGLLAGRQGAVDGEAVKSPASRDNFPWESFLVHWLLPVGLVGIVVGMYVFLFFLNLRGSAWLAVFWTGLGLAVTGAGLIFHARLPL